MLFVMLNSKVQHRNLKIISTTFLAVFTPFHEDTDNQIIMKNIKRKIENTASDHIKGSFQESNIFLSQLQPKNLLRSLSNSFISRKLIIPKGIFRCMIKDVKHHTMF